MKLRLKLKPSTLGQYYEKQCDKYLVCNSISDKELEQLNWDAPKVSRPSVSAMAGNDWEAMLFERLQQDAACEVINLKEEGHKASYLKTVETLKSLKTTDKPIYLYQACFEVPDSFKSRYLSTFKEDGSEVAFSKTMYPDFIKAEYIHSEGKYRLTVIDAKNASKLKVGAEMQIALYVKLLKCIITDEGIDNCFVNEEEGIVWNREKITDNRLDHVFKLQDAFREIDEFFDKTLISIYDILNSCNSGLDVQNEIDYCISSSCEYCRSFDACKNYCQKKRNVRMMAYITPEAQRRLKELMDDGLLVDDTFDSVKTLLSSDEERRRLTSDCFYWQNVNNNLIAYQEGLQSYYEGKKGRFPKSASSLSFPIAQEFALILTAQQDENSGRVYGYAWLLRPGKGIDIWDQGLNENGYVSLRDGRESSSGKGTYFDSVVALEESQEEFDRIDRVFVESIYELLKRISEYPEKRGLQCFVMDNYEWKNIENALFYMLEYLDPEKEQDLLEKVMAILFLMQGERLVAESNLQPEKCVENPVTVLTSEISRLYVLPEGIAYSLRNVASIFSPKYNFDEDKSNHFGILTNVVEGMNIISAWKEADKEKKEKYISGLAYHLRKRLFVEANIISAIQDDHKDKKIYLNVWPAQYYMQTPKYPGYPEIARLDFENRYEQLLTYRQIRAARMTGIENAIDNGTILWLEYTGTGNTYKILNYENYIGREWFTVWLCEDTPENRTQLMLLRDTRYTAVADLGYKYFCPQYKVRDTDTVFYPAGFDQDYNYTDDGEKATVDFYHRVDINEKYIPLDAQFKPVKGKKYLLFEVYSDDNSQKTAAGIGKLIDGREFPNLLNPKELSGDTGITYNDDVKSICSKYWSPDGKQFSQSQEKAFIHLLERKLNVLVGPPASGKTDFISRALITIAGYCAEKEGKKLKIMVTAMSHSAIDNVLLKLHKMLEKSNPHNIGVYKVGKFDDKKAFIGKNVTLLSDGKYEVGKIAEQVSEEKIQIIGITSWGAHKAFHSNADWMREFDMIVIDEASQVRAMDAFLNLECSNKNTRYLLVGDDDQLPPIINGKYKEVEGKKYIHGSIFKMYMTGLGEGHQDIVRLSDNFRMNGILCKYPAKAIYSPDYKAANNVIKNQKISLIKESKDSLIASLLDPEYPLVFCELSGIAREQTKAEVELVTRLVSGLWESQRNEETGRLAKDDGNFWRDITKGKDFYEGVCGIISPHHEHINRLKTSIIKALGIERSDIFIGTVDKLQGKERKTVIVSYGVSEMEKIINESEFIFSSNRFNVSITRGKAKTIIFLSDAIAEPNLTTNIMSANDEALKKGIEFIHGFSEYMDKCEDGEALVKEEYPYNGGDVSLKVWKKKLSDC